MAPWRAAPPPCTSPPALRAAVAVDEAVSPRGPQPRRCRPLAMKLLRRVVRLLPLQRPPTPMRARMLVGGVGIAGWPPPIRPIISSLAPQALAPPVMTPRRRYSLAGTSELQSSDGAATRRGSLTSRGFPLPAICNGAWEGFFSRRFIATGKSTEIEMRQPCLRSKVGLPSDWWLAAPLFTSLAPLPAQALYDFLHDHNRLRQEPPSWGGFPIVCGGAVLLQPPLAHKPAHARRPESEHV